MIWVAYFLFGIALLGTLTSAIFLLLIIVGVFAVLFLGHSLIVRHHLREHGNQDMFRSVNALRERRGF